MDAREKMVLASREREKELRAALTRVRENSREAMAELQVKAKTAVKKAWASAGSPATVVATTFGGYALSRAITRAAGEEKGRAIRLVFATLCAFGGGMEIAAAAKTGRPPKKWAEPLFYVGMGLGARDAIPFADSFVDSVYDRLANLKK
jgi:hypothetical protein